LKEFYIEYLKKNVKDCVEFENEYLVKYVDGSKKFLSKHYDETIDSMKKIFGFTEEDVEIIKEFFKMLKERCRPPNDKEVLTYAWREAVAKSITILNS